MASKLRHIQRNLYHLGKRYGKNVYLNKISSHSTDLQTGVKTTSYDISFVRNALVLRAREFQAFVYDLAFISANKDFTTGGFFDLTRRWIVLRASNLPEGVVPNVGDRVSCESTVYEVTEVLHFEYDIAYALMCNMVDGGVQLLPSDVKSALSLQSSAVATTIDNLQQSLEGNISLTHELREVV